MNKMLLKIALVAASLIGSASFAMAACVGPAVMHDFPGTSFNMSLGTNAGDGNCVSNTAIVGTLPGFASTPTVNIGGTLPAFASTPTFNLGTLNGAATAALQTTGNTALTTINTTLGSPFQVGGSIGNTTFAVTQGTAANLNATVVGTGTFAVQLTGATNNINNIAGTISLPTGASTSANQTTSIGILNGVAQTTAHGCSVAGYGVLGCLGQIDDDVKGAIPAGTNLIGKVGIDQTTPGTTNGVQLPATQAGGVPLGQALAAASVPVVMTAAQVTTLTPPSNTGYATSANQITGSAYGNNANFSNGTSGNVDNTAQTTIIGAPVAGRLFVTDVECFNSGSTNSTITLNDGAATVLFNPAGAGVVKSFLTPLIVGATTALKFTPGSSSTHQWCNAQSYNAS